MPHLVERGSALVSPSIAGKVGVLAPPIALPSTANGYADARAANCQTRAWLSGLRRDRSQPRRNALSADGTKRDTSDKGDREGIPADE
jgi:hypothetical protein